MRIKKLTVLILAGMLAISQSMPTLATSPVETRQANDGMTIVPFWVNVNDVTLDLSFTNGNASCSGKISGLSGTTSIKATFKLERETSSGWELEKSWSKDSSGRTLSFSGTDAVTSGYNYRFSVTATIVRNGASEKISTFVEERY